MADERFGKLTGAIMHMNFRQGRNQILGLMALCATLAPAFIGCSHKPSADQELQNTANAFEKAEPAPASPQKPSPPQPSQQPAPAAAPSTAPPPAQQFNQAMAAYKAGNLDDAVTRLQKLRATPAMTPQQRIALNDAMAAVMTEIYSLAAKGNARAQQAVKQYEQMQTSRQAR